MPAGSRAPDHDAKPTRLPSGSWGVRVSLGGTRYHRTAPTAADARAARDELKRQHRLGLLAPPPRSSGESETPPTVADALAAWLAGIRPQLEPSSHARYALECEKRLVPALGGVPLAALQRAQVRAALDGMRPAVSGRTVRYARETLRLALQRAVDDGLLPGGENPAAGIRLPKDRRAPARALGPADVQALLAVHDRWHPLWLVGLYTGMRLGELLGLPWSQVDWQRGSVQVCQVLAVGVDGAYRLRGYPKRAASVRRIGVPAEVVDALTHLRDGQNAAQRALGLVFSSRVGTPLLPSNVIRTFRAACRAAGITLVPGSSIHGLRHTFASALLAAGRPITEVSYLLGHANPATTLAIYAHYLPHETAPAADALRAAYTRDVPERDETAPNDAETASLVGRCQ